MIKLDIYQHFRKEERPFIDQILSWQTEVERSFIPKLTEFLDPREQLIFKTVIGKHPDFTLDFFGGKGAERKRAILAPYYETVDEKDFDLVLLEAVYPQKFITLTHRDVLGAFMSLGIKRKKVGDLIVRDGVIQIVATGDIVDYIRMNMTGVKKANIQFEVKSFDQMLQSTDVWESAETTVSSLRLDVIVKEIYRISRQNAGLLIEKGHVKVNFRVVEDTSFQLESGDMISVRKKGRSKLVEVHGTTKKEKFRITTSKLK
ncbi:YlmH family RNA-binding protein [Thalassobacillus hwangdonensis]|uniref:RNA-binding protein n=1 Tax=Thalassobacillus hwangdonensis TaxID=546108 RepID=A0ABW3L0I6_9BACI